MKWRMAINLEAAKWGTPIRGAGRRNMRATAAHTFIDKTGSNRVFVLLVATRGLSKFSTKPVATAFWSHGSDHGVVQFDKPVGTDYYLPVETRALLSTHQPGSAI